MEGLLQLFREVGAKGASPRTIAKLLDELCVDRTDGTLGAVVKLSKILADNSLETVPTLTKGDLESPRIVRFASVTAFSMDDFRRDIANGESSDLELKSTLLFDIKRHLAKPGELVDTYRSDEVLHACLKTIAAFLNSYGGVLYVGVSDNGEVCGLENDFKLTATRDRDKFELFLRDCITKRFCDGGMISDFVDVKFGTIGEYDIARISITARPIKLSFLKRPSDDVYRLFRRDGNRTVEVKFENVEEFLSRRTLRLKD
jgi:hypothetical protein